MKVSFSDFETAATNEKAAAEENKFTQGDC